MPLAGAMAINFSAPLFAAVVSIVWLKEQAGLVRGLALLVGFCGVLIVTNPGREFADARRAVRARQRRDVRHRHRRGSRHDQNEIGQHVGDLAVHGAGILSQLLVVVRLALADAGSMPRCCSVPASSMRSGNGAGPRRCIWRRRAAVTPFYYLMLVWALVIGFLVWGEVPTVSLLDRIGHRRRHRSVPVLARSAIAAGALGAAAEAARDRPRPGIAAPGGKTPAGVTFGQIGSRKHKTAGLRLQRIRRERRQPAQAAWNSGGKRRGTTELHKARVCGAALPSIATPSSALDYPTRPVHVLVGQAAGSSSDITARLIGQYLE